MKSCMGLEDPRLTHTSSTSSPGRVAATPTLGINRRAAEAPGLTDPRVCGIPSCLSLLRAIIFRDGGNPHSTSHYSSTRRNSYLRVITLQLEAIHILRVVTLRRDETSLLRVITVEVKETPILRVNIRDEEIYNLRGTVYDRYFVEEPPRPHSRSYPMSTRQLDGAQTRNIAAVGDVRR